MCLGSLQKRTWSTPCGTLRGSSVAKLIKAFIKIVKSVLARCLYTLYGFIAVWRVTEAKQDSSYWLLLFALCPLGLETIHAILRKGTEMKWMTPSILYFLLIGIPCVWLMELKLLEDRLQSLVSSSASTNSSQTVSSSPMIPISISLSDSGWTLALEQILIFVLVMGKWIGPKGEMSRSELSQLLLVNIAAGADIIELLEVFGEDKVSQNREIVFLVMAMWSWSLLQFCLVLTASKELPELHDDSSEIMITAKNVNIHGKTEDMSKASKTCGNGQSNDTEANVIQRKKVTNKFNGISNDYPSKQMLCEKNGTKKNPLLNGELKQSHTNNSASNGNKQLPVIVAPGLHEDKPSPTSPGEYQILSAEDIKAEDRFQADEIVEKCVTGQYCFECFCCYTEVWGMVMSMVFQDGPFFILRMFIMFHYRVITHMNVFFTCKNALVILLLLNRIRVIILEEYKPWKAHMTEFKYQRQEEADEKRQQLGLQLKSSQPLVEKENSIVLDENAGSQSRPTTGNGLRKPRWVTWRA